MRPLLLLAFLSLLATARPDGVPAARLSRLARGVNLSHWLWLPQAKTPEERREFFTAADTKLIRDLGLTHVRLPIEPATLWDTRAHTLNPEPTAELKSAIDLCLKADLAIIVDAHPTKGDWFTPGPSNHCEELERFWSALAKELAATDPDRVFLEILNEPHDLKDPAAWPAAQAHLAAAVRAAAPRHTLIATGDDWGNIAGLLRLTPLPDPNIVYSFHFYEPHTFTHQGATWGWAPWKFIKGLPYPSSPETAGPIADKIDDQQAAAAVRTYGQERWDAARIRARIGEAKSWSEHNHVPIYCGELGVYREHAPPDSRHAWLRNTAAALNDARTGWALWDYCGGFALTSGTPGRRTADPDTADALGLKR